ncbi:cation diffusion facilitator family transporter [Povalibacter uvarum]|uniref:Cation diffusion facilitator family transporter n=1 Tax=Povalibacter uvarum TaxID=732238 RepID=A0A841HHY6_9GAMM|nr:cation diffusion facilitator family transporter [Povalibacter uvarum]MBB6092406.1 cation diffusion facilitator family transporter [Povalibacter uvarum]
MSSEVEQSTLKFSIALTLLLGVLGIASGLATGSQAIVFDGMYSFVDVVPTVVSLVVVRLIAHGSSHRFQYGYWHLEPLVAVLRDSILVVACIYAAVDAVGALAGGGNEVAYGMAAVWAGVLSTIGLAMTLYLSRLARKLRSPMLRLDARSWLVSAFLSLALLIGFAIAAGLARTRYQGWTPYLDAIALLAIALCMLPMPLIGLWRSMSDVLQVAPDDLDKQVHAVMNGIVGERGFLDYSSYVAKVGRARFVEIHVLVAPDARIDTAAADAIRRDIAKRLNAVWPNFWLTVDFTADRAWL